MTHPKKGPFGGSPKLPFLASGVVASGRDPPDPIIKETHFFPEFLKSKTKIDEIVAFEDFAQKVTLDGPPGGNWNLTDFRYQKWTRKKALIIRQ